MSEEVTTPVEVVPVTPLTSLADIQKLCAQYKSVEFTLDGKPCALQVRRLTPTEEARRLEIIDSVIPPIIKGRTPEEDRLDTTNPEYQKRKAESVLKARAQALYWAVSAIASDKPGLTNLDDITRHVQSQLTDATLNLLWNGVMESGISQAELVNFT